MTSPGIGIGVLMLAACLVVVNAAPRIGFNVGYQTANDVVSDGAVQTAWAASNPKPMEIGSGQQSLSFTLSVSAVQTGSSPVTVHWATHNPGAVVTTSVSVGAVGVTSAPLKQPPQQPRTPASNPAAAHNATNATASDTSSGISPLPIIRPIKPMVDAVVNVSTSSGGSTALRSGESVVLTVWFECNQAQSAANSLSLDVGGSYDNVTISWSKVCAWPEIYVALDPSGAEPYLVKGSVPTGSFEAPFAANSVLYLWTAADDRSVRSVPVRSVSVSIEPASDLVVSYGFTATEPVITPFSSGATPLGLWIVYSCLKETTDTVKLTLELNFGWSKRITLPWSKLCTRKPSPKLQIGYKSDSDVVSNGYIQSGWINSNQPFDLGGVNFFNLKFSYPQSASQTLKQSFSIETTTVTSFGPPFPVPPSAFAQPGGSGGSSTLAYRVRVPSFDSSAPAAAAASSASDKSDKSDKSGAPTNSNGSGSGSGSANNSTKSSQKPALNGTQFAVESEAELSVVATAADPLISTVQSDPETGVYSGVVGINTVLVAADQPIVNVEFDMRCAIDGASATTRIDIGFVDSSSSSGGGSAAAQPDPLSLFFTKTCRFPTLEIGTTPNDSPNLVRGGEGLKGSNAFVASDDSDSTQFFVWLRANSPAVSRSPVLYSVRASSSSDLVVHTKVAGGGTANSGSGVATVPARDGDSSAASVSSFTLSFECPEPSALKDGENEFPVTLSIDIGWEEALTVSMTKACPTPATIAERAASGKSSGSGSGSGSGGSGGSAWVTAFTVLFCLGGVIWIGLCVYNVSVDQRRGCDAVPGGEYIVRCYEEVLSPCVDSCQRYFRRGGGDGSGSYQSVSQHAHSSSSNGSGGGGGSAAYGVGSNKGVTPQMDVYDEELDRHNSNGGIFGSGVPNGAGSDYQSDL